MSRNSRDSLIGNGRSMLLIHRRGLSANNGAFNLKDFAADEVDLFSKSRRTDESDASLKLGKQSVGSAKQAHNGSEDLLSSGGEKHDYDWLLTPPGTPMAPSSNGNETRVSPLGPRGRSSARSTSTTRPSQLSTSWSEHADAVKPSRSSSLTRPSVSSSRHSNYSNKSTAILNTSSASVSSHARLVTPARRSLSSTPSSRPSVSRSTPPSSPRPAASSSPVDKPRPSLHSRPSTPTSRSQTSTNSNGTPARIASRPSTPTRHSTTYSSSVSAGPAANGGRSLSNGRSITPVSCPGSHGARVRPSPQPTPLPDCSQKTPQTPRTTLPDRRPSSVGRSRTGAAPVAERNGLISATISALRRHPSPISTKGGISSNAKGQTTEGVDDSHRESPARKPLKTSSDSTGFGRTLSKSSLDMAIRHMDIRNGINGPMSLAAAKLFPHSIRSSRQKNQSWSGSASSSISAASNDTVAEKVGPGVRHSERRIAEVTYEHSAKITCPDIYESSRYDMMLLKEDVKNTNWLHSIDDKPDQELVFDNGFEPLPEPFGPV